MLSGSKGGPAVISSDEQSMCNDTGASPMSARGRSLSGSRAAPELLTELLTSFSATHTPPPIVGVICRTWGRFLLKFMPIFHHFSLFCLDNQYYANAIEMYMIVTKKLGFTYILCWILIKMRYIFDPVL